MARDGQARFGGGASHGIVGPTDIMFSAGARPARGIKECIVAPKRVILRAELTPQAKTGLERICDQRGMTQVSVMSRLILWFAAQEGKIQHAILGHTGENAAELLVNDLIRRVSDASSDNGR